MTVPTRYAYLLTEAGKARYVLAAHYVRGCEHVVEIGGFTDPITGYLTEIPQTLLVLDPRTEAYHAEQLSGHPCRVDHVPALFQDYEFDLDPGSYGLVILGLSLKRFSDSPAVRKRQWSKLVKLVDDSRVTVVDYARDWPLANEEVASLLAETGARVAVQFDMNIGSADTADTVGADRHVDRRFMVLVPQRSEANFPA